MLFPLKVDILRHYLYIKPYTDVIMDINLRDVLQVDDILKQHQGLNFHQLYNLVEKKISRHKLKLILTYFLETKYTSVEDKKIIWNGRETWDKSF
jgi:hypothetical protein